MLKKPLRNLSVSRKDDVGSIRTDIVRHVECDKTVVTMNVKRYCNQRRDRNNDSGAALIMVVVLSAIIYLAITLLLLLTSTETQVSFFEQRSMQAFYAAESALTLGIANLRANNGQPLKITNELVTFADELIAFSSEALPPTQTGALYHHSAFGGALISGATGATRRGVAQDVIIKPFTLFASERLSLAGGVKIVGHTADIASNIHGGQHVRLTPGVSVAGNVTSGANIECQNRIIAPEGKITCPANPITGIVQIETDITFPQMSSKVYAPQYMFHGKLYDAEALGSPNIVALVPKGEVEPPARAIHLYVRRPDPTKNPAGIFYADTIINDDASNTLTNLDIEGTLLLQGAGDWKIKGIVKISAVENFPALLSFSSASCLLTYIPFESIEPYLPEEGNGRDMNTTNHISGLIYSQGDVTLNSHGVDGEFIHGSVFAKNIEISGEIQFVIRYDLRVLTDSPPGLHLVETLNWREYIGENLADLIKQ